MARPKKNEAEQPLNLEGVQMPIENENAQQNANNAAEASEEQQMMPPIELESYGEMPLASADMMSFLILAPADIEARKGRIYLKTGIIIKDGYRGLVLPTSDNAAYGLKTETDYRLVNSDVIPMQAPRGKDVKIVLNINDDTMIQEQTNFGTRSRNLVIPKGTPLAELMLFKL